ncbi:MAG TPA: CGNR zinc finger domain-containing protein [Thermoanaerobaculia bacterium]|nr:CGNR zinc finger domain-containing protein [Thermoanaerobaculia bacterium]
MTRFVFVGGAPVIDFVNTEIISGGERVDLLQTSDDLRDWLRDAGLSADAARVPLDEIKQFRTQIRAMLVRKKAQKNHIESINAALRRGRGAMTLEKASGRWEVKFQAESDDPLFLIAAAAAELLANKDLSLVKSCGGTGCILLFHDETKSHSRRWCSMAGCGNRMKAALHYRRTREEGVEDEK